MIEYEYMTTEERAEAEEEAKENAFQEQQAEAQRSFRAENLYAAVCTFEPRWAKSVIRYRHEKILQDTLKTSRRVEDLVA